MKPWIEAMKRGKLRHGFDCVTRDCFPSRECTPLKTELNLKGEWNSRLKDWKGHLLVQAKPPGMGAWLKEHAYVNTGSFGTTPSCWEGIFRTTGSLLRERPRGFYRHLAQELNKSPNPSPPVGWSWSPPPPPPVGLGVSPVGHCCALAFHISNQHKQLLLVCTLTYDQTLTKNMQHTDI